MKMRNRTILLIIVVFVAVTGTYAYNVLFKDNVTADKIVVTVPKNATMAQLTDSLTAKNAIQNLTSFKLTCRLMRFKTPRMGHYELTSGMSNIDLVRMLRRGQHYGVNFTFNNLRTKKQFIEKVDHRFFFNPEDLERLLSDSSYLAQYGFNTETCIAAFIPDSYEFFYDITAEDFFEKMLTYYHRFWNEERLKTAESIGLTPVEVAVWLLSWRRKTTRPPKRQ